MVRTVYSEKKPAFAVEAAGVLSDIKRTLNIKLENVRLINRYFVTENLKKFSSKCFPYFFHQR